MRYAKEKIFSLYQRFHPSMPGKGFGLFLVKTQVEAMNGSINVHSEVNKGTIFQITVRSA
jgi:signal transduction histidine kinase